MPILLWYLPFTMFSGACDLVFSEFETQMAGEGPAGSGERPRESDHPDRFLNRGSQHYNCSALIVLALAMSEGRERRGLQNPGARAFFPRR